MGEPFAAVNTRCLSGERFLKRLLGITEISAPVSIRNDSLFFLQVINKRRLFVFPTLAEKTKGRSNSFPNPDLNRIYNCLGYTFWRFFQIYSDTNKKDDRDSNESLIFDD